MSKIFFFKTMFYYFFDGQKQLVRFLLNCMTWVVLDALITSICTYFGLFSLTEMVSLMCS